MKISEERILQICNDIAEDIDNGPTVEELKACVRYWQDLYVNLHMKVTADETERLLQRCVTHPVACEAERVTSATGRLEICRDGQWVPLTERALRDAVNWVTGRPYRNAP